MQELKFFNLRRHLYTRKKTKRKHLSTYEIYKRKEESRQKRQRLANSEEGREFYKWLYGIQGSLKLSDRKFAELIGISIQTLWRLKEQYGNFPSHKTFERLLELERLCRIKVEVK